MNERHLETHRRADDGSARPVPLDRRASRSGKTSVTRELPVGGAVKLRHFALVPACGSVRTTLLFTMSMNRQQACRRTAHRNRRLSLLCRRKRRRMPRIRLRRSGKAGGARRDRTDDLMLAKHALSQLSYGPARTQPQLICRESATASSSYPSSCRCSPRKWWAREDSNCRPHPYQACALTT